MIEGPSGGASVNVYCTNVGKCGSKFNDTPFQIERITDASPNKPPTVETHSTSVYR